MSIGNLFLVSARAKAAAEARNGGTPVAKTGTAAPRAEPAGRDKSAAPCQPGPGSRKA